jgi:hypothetical protein
VCQHLLDSQSNPRNGQRDISLFEALWAKTKKKERGLLPFEGPNLGALFLPQIVKFQPPIWDKDMGGRKTTQTILPEERSAE